MSQRRAVHWRIAESVKQGLKVESAMSSVPMEQIADQILAEWLSRREHTLPIDQHTSREPERRRACR
jgi:hypothetical protein